jgi:N-acetylmuramoyl-L-alanine amidase
MATMVVDAGRRCADPGAVGPDATHERWVNRRAASAIGEQRQRMGRRYSIAAPREHGRTPLGGQTRWKA